MGPDKITLAPCVNLNLPGPQAAQNPAAMARDPSVKTDEMCRAKDNQEDRLKKLWTDERCGLWPGGPVLWPRRGFWGGPTPMPMPTPRPYMPPVPPFFCGGVTPPPHLGNGGFTRD